MSCPLAHETLALAMRAAGIFFLECRDSNHRTNMAVTAVDGYESAQERVHQSGRFSPDVPAD